MVVADGAGDLGSGALASRVAISTLAHLAVHSGKWNLRVDADTALAIAAQAEWLYQRAAHAVERQGMTDPSLKGMRTTLTVTFSAGDELFYANVGSSRAYLFRSGELIRLTGKLSDRQSLPLPGLMAHVAANVRDLLNNGIGGGSGLPPIDVERIHLLHNDIVLLCTQGVMRALDDETIADCLAQPRAMKQQCRELIDLATSRDADEDATVVLARYWIPPLRRSQS
jgi:protein phosphatase